MAYGPNFMRNGAVLVFQPAGGAAASAITITGTVWPNGHVVETAWGANSNTAPETGWGVATAVGGSGGGRWTRTTTRPAAGTWYLHARQVLRPAVRTFSAAVIVT